MRFLQTTVVNLNLFKEISRIFFKKIYKVEKNWKFIYQEKNPKIVPGKKVILVVFYKGTRIVQTPVRLYKIDKERFLSRKLPTPQCKIRPDLAKIPTLMAT